MCVRIRPHLHTARQVGEALAGIFEEGVVERSDLFITSKLWNTFHSPTAVEAACKRSLTALRLTYLDLYLVGSLASSQCIGLNLFMMTSRRPQHFPLSLHTGALAGERQRRPRGSPTLDRHMAGHGEPDKSRDQAGDSLDLGVFPLRISSLRIQLSDLQ